jgi:lipopolysaccharide export system permease protein
VRILQRYILRELLGQFAGVTIALAAILLIYQIGQVLARAAQLQYPRGLVLELFALGAAENFAILLPLGLLLGAVLAFGRLYFDGEFVAAQACGYGRWRAWVPMLLLALPVAALSAWLNLQLAPAAASQRAALAAEALRAGLAVPFEPGRFRSFDDGRTVVYARSASDDGELRSVFIKQSTGTLLATTVAERARRELGADGLSQVIVLQEGERTEGVPGAQHYRTLRFAELRIPLAAPAAIARRERLDEKPSLRLLASRARLDRAELQWRIGLPIMVLVIAACALPLGRLQPRQGRYARVWLAVLLFAVYGNLATAARTWFEHGVTPAALGMWWVHGLFALLAAALIAGPRLRWSTRWRSAHPAGARP